MCGIVAYVGDRDCTPILVGGLKRLEYRGYDSSGLAVRTQDGGIEVVRSVGKLQRLEAALAAHPLFGTDGIGHTRWATHGRPNETNAHPHAAGSVVLVHNGIVENHVALRAELEAEGVRFASETDTEVLAHLIAKAVDGGAPNLETAVRRAITRVQGSYALAVMSTKERGKIVVAKNDSPLILAHNEGEAFAASDIPAILPHVPEVLILEDGEVATLERAGITITDANGERVVRQPHRVSWSLVESGKGGFKHYMLKEIHEQPRALEHTIRGRISSDGGDVVLPESGLTPETAKEIRRVCFIACGSSSNAALTGRYWMEQLGGVRASVEVGSEVRYRDAIFGPEDLVVAISQSGETADTLAALRTAREAGARVLAIVNVRDSAIARASDGVLYTHAGPEVAVASTKCFTAQLAALLLLAVHVGRTRGSLSHAEGRRILEALKRVPGQVRTILANARGVRGIAKKHHQSKSMLVLGRGPSYPVALETALKVKEISYIHAEGYAAGEMKHGPIALVDETMPVVVLCPQDRHHDKTLSNMQEVMARGAKIIVVCTKDDAELTAMAAVRARLAASPDGSEPPPSSRPHPGNVDVIEIPDARSEVLPLLTVVPMQLLSYNLALLQGRDVDQPRNLAKTVTVE
ncbi:MAG: glutamine--fructose-6-phosphate transaminase (isomerizing) [Myxococcales bacterium]|nr:glutamine--fructose-6-phosphate transaminase (isomerizing) [Myxococcales bacterium]